ncbi:MAG: biotin synthase [Rhodoferax sp.]|uniref:class I SAM-dependent methyltransferase n=1 Tax=Rhodoferax sp. TaxID=50421 RepID=UPI002604B83E|nr:biotin synthase [Rhodoferax sp.]MDD2879582.1 biotin synthase [Rhodoferax sp.]
MADLHPPTIDPTAAQRWQGMPLSASPWLHEEVAQRMQERLDWIKQQPDSWVHWAPLSGGMQAHGSLARRYPNAACTVLETSPQRVAQVAQTLKPSWWSTQRWLQPQAQVGAQVTQPAQMLWANMCLHMAADPQALMAQWHRALKVDGFLMFSCLGPDTLKELRALYQSLGWPAPSHEFTDMHDWGDMLATVGFAEPVMDVEHITLTFESPERLLQELRGLGRNLHVGRFQGMRGRRWHAELLAAAAKQPLQLTFEVVYGHAFKPTPRLTVSAQSEISLDEMRATLRRGKMVGTTSLPKEDLHD